ncbi:MAG: hypothetical protein ACREMJ_03505 [Gemmatimonadales bacterium]
MPRPFAILALAATLVAAPAGAQERGRFEAGVFTRATLFDPSLDVDLALGAGLRAAVFLSPRWLVEADLSVSGVDGLATFPETSYRPFHLRVNYLRPYSERGGMIVGLGLVANSYGGDFDENDAGVAGLFGFRIGLTRTLVLRTDGTLDYVPEPGNGAGDNWIAGIQVGLGYRLGAP